MSGDELYRYLYISKRKMRYLLMNGFIPCIDTGKKTHRYIVLRAEVKKYIERRKNDPSVDAQLQGKFGHEVKKQPVIQVSDEKCEAFGKYLRKTWSAEPEALPAVRVAELVGIHRQRIYDLCRKNAIFYIMIGDRMICGKESVIKYFSSPAVLCKPNITSTFSELVRKFENL